MNFLTMRMSLQDTAQQNLRSCVEARQSGDPTAPNPCGRPSKQSRPGETPGPSATSCERELGKSSPGHSQKPEEDGSESSESSSEVDRAGARRRNLQATGRYRCRKYVDLLMDVKTVSNMTLLERKAVGDATEKMYMKEDQLFMNYAKPKGISLDNSELVDHLLATCVTQQFLRGHRAHVGDRQMARWLHHPSHGRAANPKAPPSPEGMASALPWKVKDTISQIRCQPPSRLTLYDLSGFEDLGSHEASSSLSGPLGVQLLAVFKRCPSEPLPCPATAEHPSTGAATTEASWTSRSGDIGKQPKARSDTRSQLAWPGAGKWCLRDQKTTV